MLKAFYIVILQYVINRKSPVTIKHIGQGMPLDAWGYAVIVD